MDTTTGALRSIFASATDNPRRTSSSTTSSSISSSSTSFSSTAAASAISTTTSHTTMPSSAASKPSPTPAVPACILKPSVPSYTKLSGDFDLNQIFLIVSTACIIIVTIASLFLILTHLIWRVDLNIQKQYMRLIMLLPVFALLNYGTLWAYSDSTYFQAATKIYETFCMTCFFSYMIYMKFPDPIERVKFFVGLERLHRRAKKGRLHDKGSLRWYYVRSLSVFQAPVIATLIFIIDAIIANVGCPTSKGSQVANGIFEFVGIISTVFAITGIFQTYRRLQHLYKGSGIANKFFAFKGFVLVITHQQFVFAIITISKSVPPTEYMSSADLSYGIPAFMICCEALIFTPIFVYAFSGFPFRRMLKRPELETAVPNPTHESFGTFLLSLFFPKDFFQGLAQAGWTIRGYLPGAKPFDYTGGTGVGFLEREDRVALKEQQQKQSGDSTGSESDLTMGQPSPQPPMYNALGR